MLAYGILAILSLVSVGYTRAGNTTCLNNSMDWFTQSVGETPCRVYERLRGLCSPGFQVGNMNYIPPGDKCGDQVVDCCCNTVAFALSMLCMSCQYGIGSGENGDYGFDAPEGTYSQFLNNCGRPTNTSLPRSVQKAVCNANIKIPSYVYTPSWQTTGAWYFYYTRQTAQLQINNGENDTSSRCNEAFATGGATSPTVTVTVSSDSTSLSTISSGVYVKRSGIIGIAFGGIGLLCLGVVAGFFFSKWHTRRGPNRGAIDLIEEHDRPGLVYEPYRYTTPATQLRPVSYNVQDDSAWTYTDSSSSSLVRANTGAAVIPTSAAGSRRQKGRNSRRDTTPNRGLEGSARPPAGRTHPTNEFQTAGPSQHGSELPPSYEPRHS